MQFNIAATALSALLATVVAGAAAPNAAGNTNLARGKLARDYAALAGLDVTSEHTLLSSYTPPFCPVWGKGEGGGQIIIHLPAFPNFYFF